MKPMTECKRMLVNGKIPAIFILIIIAVERKKKQTDQKKNVSKEFFFI
jgi:hypothetical protein